MVRGLGAVLVAIGLVLILVGPVLALGAINDYTNQRRASVGLPALATSALLEQVAAQRAYEVSLDGGWGHNGNQTERLGCWRWGENIAWHSYGWWADDAAQFVQQWWDSPSHKANMLGGWTLQGSGTHEAWVTVTDLVTGEQRLSHRLYAVQLFLLPCDAPAPAPAPGPGGGGGGGSGGSIIGPPIVSEIPDTASEDAGRMDFSFWYWFSGLVGVLALLLVKVPRRA